MPNLPMSMCGRKLRPRSLQSLLQRFLLYFYPLFPLSVAYPPPLPRVAQVPPIGPGRRGEGDDRAHVAQGTRRRTRGTG
jgi:hypothetical protein